MGACSLKLHIRLGLLYWVAPLLGALRAIISHISRDYKADGHAVLKLGMCVVIHIHSFGAAVHFQRWTQRRHSGPSR